MKAERERGGIMSDLLFVVAESFVVSGRGTVLVGPPQSVARELLSAGDHIELRLPGGGVLRSRVISLERFQLARPQADPPVAVLLADDVGGVPEGTTVHRFP